MTSGQSLRVLYIDDDPGIARLVQRRLERAGIEVRLASGGDAGVVLAAGEAFDVIALDNYMPSRDGLDVLPELNALPVVFVTAAEEPRVAVAALKQGAADFILKDTQGNFLELLEPTLRQAAEAARMRKANAAAERELRDSRDQLERLAAQQSVLLREMDHRVANSLQLISAIINLQARRLPVGAARESLTRAAERVDAVARIHKRLYSSSDVAFVEMDEYLAGLVGEFRRALGADDGQQRIALSADKARLETDKAVSIGLIVNELVTNALKYAYPEGIRGVVRVVFSCVTTGGLRLAVEDDGTGYPEGTQAAKGSGVGGLIVAAMAEKLHATLTRDQSWTGTRFVLEIPA